MPSISPNAHGIYLREPQEIDKDFECTVFVDPIFPDTLESINEKKFQFEMKCSLSCDQDWVSHAKHVLLMHGGRGFDVKVDPKELAPGVHYAEIIGFDSKAPAKGPLFRVPITVIKPDKKSEDSSRYMYSKIDFSPGGIHRKFFIAPTGSQIAKITVRSIGKQATSRTYMLHCVYNELEAAHTKSSLQKHFVMNDGDEQVFCAPVRENTMVEITLAQFWKSLGTSSLSLDVEFHGVQVNPGAINLDGANIISRIDIHSLLNKEKVNLSASIKTLEYQISPNDDETRILPLSSPRDVLPNGKLVYQLLLNYSLELGEKETLTIRAPVLCDLLYESNYESQMWLVYDSRKKLVSKGDFRPKPITLPQGSYTIKYQVKHEDIKALERLKNMNIVARRNLTKKVGLSCFKTYQSALENSNVVSKFDIGSGQRKAVFIRLPEDFSVIYKALPKKVGKGKAYKFTGELTVLSLNGTGSSKVEIPIFVNDIFYPKSDSKDKKSVKKTESFDVSKEHNYALVKWLSGLKPEEFNQAFEVYGKSLVDNDSKNVSVILIQLKNAVSEAKACSSPDAKLELLHKVVDLSDKIFNSLDLQDLASHLGKKVQEDAESVAKNEEIQKSKESLQEALLRKSLAMLEIRKISLTQVDFSMDTWESDWKAHLSMLKSWVDLEKETKFQIVHIQSLLLSGKLGLALKYVSKAISEGECGDQLELWELRQQILSSLGPHWSHWANHFKTLKLSSFPGDYQPF